MALDSSTRNALLLSKGGTITAYGTQWAMKGIRTLHITLCSVNNPALIT